LGNHEFDLGPRGLAAILKTGLAEGVTFPVVASNMKFDPASPDEASDVEAHRELVG
jgi:2',3'-cyclic-nucleotide 2'-phosphodiesterase (5'-nucleotidase family)